MTTPTAKESRALLERQPDHDSIYNRTLRDHLRAALDREAALRAERDAAREEAENLWQALAWLDTFSPEDVAATEAHFGLDVSCGAPAQEPVSVRGISREGDAWLDAQKPDDGEPGA